MPEYLNNGNIQNIKLVDNNGQILNSGAIQLVELVNSLSGSASGGWNTMGELSFVSIDTPSFVYQESGNLTGTYFPGQRVKLTNNTLKYAIITKVDYSGGNTQLNFYGGTDYVISGTISNPYYSREKIPLGFPTEQTKWTVSVTYSGSVSQASPVQNTWYNITGSITIPIGFWDVGYIVYGQVTRASAGAVAIATTLSTANNSQSDVEFSDEFYVTNITTSLQTLRGNKQLLLTSKTPYYLNTRTVEASMQFIYNRGDNISTRIFAKCAYL